MSADISNIITVQLLPEGLLAARDNMNVVAIFTAQQTGPLSTANRYELYSDIASVAADFGTDSAFYDFAQTLFASQPNPITAGGVLVAAYWRGASESVASTPAVLTGAELVAITAIDQLQQISDGTLDIDVDGVTINVTAIDGRTITSLAGIAAVLDAAIAGASISVSDDDRIIITSATTGVTSTISVASDPGSGTYIGTILGLGAGTGAVATQGAAAAVLAAETKVSAVTAVKALVNFKGFCFVDSPTSGEAEDLAEWAQSNSVLGYDVFSLAANLEIATSNVVWAIKLASLTNYRMLYSAADNRKLAAAYMSRAHVVDFNAEKSALTMHLKALSVPAENYTQTQINKARAVGLDIYTTIKNTPVVLTSGANDFQDNRYNLIAFIDAVQTDMFNLLKQTATKIPQTQAGVNQLIDQGEKTSRGFVRAGAIAPGTWSSPDFFGNKETFDRSILANGFYWLAGSLADQPQVDRQARKSPVLQCAIKNAGAVHSIAVIINFNA